MTNKNVIKLSPELLAALRELATVEGTSLSGLVTALLSEALGRRLGGKHHA